MKKNTDVWRKSLLTTDLLHVKKTRRKNDKCIFMVSPPLMVKPVSETKKHKNINVYTMSNLSILKDTTTATQFFFLFTD